MNSPNIPSPTDKEVEIYLEKWNSLENYRLQESSLDKLFLKTYPENAHIDDILVKCVTLNDFYRTNIFKIFPVAKHILSLDVDERLRDGDPSLVNETARVKISGKSKKFYSFATKYCSHHSPNDYPIYDYDVERVLVHFKKNDNFYQFTNADLRDYVKFKEIILVFQEFYNLQCFNLKQVDQYIWQLGKEYFPKSY